MIFESHAHYDDKAFDKDRKELLNSLQENGIVYVVNIGTTIEDSKEAIELTKNYSFMYGSIGVHPSGTENLNDDDMRILADMAKEQKIIAIGEIGLDYYWDTPSRDVQKKWFENQLQLAKEVKLPVVIHSRDAAKDTYEMIKEADLDEYRGVIHCFSYAKEVAKQYIDLGYFIGVGGVVTFKNGKKLKEVVEYIPLENILLETDAPYLAPEPNRGRRNTSLNLKYIAAEIAKIKNIEYDKVVKTTRENALKLFQKVKDRNEA